MPTYEYECPKCGHRFEEFQSINDAPIKTCPRCRGRKVKRLPGTGAGILFRGSGFHQTDYRSESYQREAKQESGSSSQDTSTPKEKKPEASKTSKTKKQK